MSDTEKVGAGGMANICWIDMALGGEVDFVVHGSDVFDAIELNHAARNYRMELRGC